MCVVSSTTNMRFLAVGIALNAAIQTLKDERSIDFALLFCEPTRAPFYIARGWKPFASSFGAFLSRASAGVSSNRSFRNTAGGIPDAFP